MNEWLIFGGVGAAIAVGILYAVTRKKKTLVKPPPVIVIPEPAKPPLKWPDRRAIGMVMCANHKEWTGEENYMTDDFEAYAERCIKNMTDINAQGCILWDGEGQKFPHPYTYIGDPKLTPAKVDPFFKTIAKAGFRTGVCIRPDEIVWEGGWPQHCVPVSHFETLVNKIEYAHKRWGCTIFYIDSNVGKGMPPGINNSVGAGDPIGADVYLDLAKLFPDFLLIPEQYHPSYLHVVAPLNNHNGHHVISGVQVLNVADTKWNDWQVFESVKAGNILIGRVWYPSPELTLIKTAYQNNKVN